MDFVGQFLADYEKKRDFYAQASRLCALRCEKVLEENGVRAIVTWREKSPASLANKLAVRDASKRYKSVEGVEEDIVDLAGVRIALYFPSEAESVKKLVREEFHVWNEKEFPATGRKSTGRFSGYGAAHYVVSLRRESLSEADAARATAKTEVQVASLLMHAWAEVNHDLDYKPTTGDISRDERDALDQLNGLVIAGEMALTQLRRGMQARISTSKQPFQNHYELGLYLVSRFPGLQSEATFGVDAALGSVEHLYRFLQQLDLHSIEALQPYLDGVNVGGEESVVEQIVNQIINAAPKARENFEAITGVTAKKQLAEVSAGSVLVGPDKNKYWYSAIDGKRYVFPTEGTFRTWYPSGTATVEVSADLLREIPIGGNVTYKPGTRLIKTKDDSKVYAVTRGGTLHWIKSEALAAAIFGQDWRALVDTLPDMFFVNYVIGRDINSSADYNPESEQVAASTVDSDKSICN